MAEHATRFAAAEFGAALRLSPITAHARVAEAVGFIDDLPLTTQCWRNGRLDRGRAMAIARATAPLDAATRRAIEQELLGDGGIRAGALTTSRLRTRVERLVIRHDPGAAIERRARAHGERQLQVTPRDDGMARFSVDLDAPVALLSHEVFDTVARGLDRECRAGRTLGQIRADVFADVVVALAVDGRVDVRSGGLGIRPDGVGDATPPSAPAEPAGPGGGAGTCCGTADPTPTLPPRWSEIGSSVSVIVDADALVPSSTTTWVAAVEPGFLAGFGWIPPDLALALASSARRAGIIVRRRQESDRSAAPPERAHRHRTVRTRPRRSRHRSSTATLPGVVGFSTTAGTSTGRHSPSTSTCGSATADAGFPAAGCPAAAAISTIGNRSTTAGSPVPATSMPCVISTTGSRRSPVGPPCGWPATVCAGPHRWAPSTSTSPTRCPPAWPRRYRIRVHHRSDRRHCPTRHRCFGVVHTRCAELTP